MPLSLPVGRQTFKKSFLSGDGKLELSSDADSWLELFDANRPFGKDTDNVAEIRLSVGSKRDLILGQLRSVKLGISAGASSFGGVQLIWPGKEADSLSDFALSKQILGSNDLYVLLSLNASGQGSAKSSYQSGPLSATFGIGAGGNVAYQRLVLHDQNDSARKIVRDLFGGVRLPQTIDQIADLPAPGEVLAFDYGGYLSLSSTLSWGYSLSGVKEQDFQNLSLELDYAVKLMASLSLAYRMAGEYRIEAARGTDTGWLRLVVRKSRQRQFEFGADFGFESSAALQGLPEGEQAADDFLAALLGVDANAWIDVLDKAGDFTNLDSLRRKVDDLVYTFLNDLAQDWLGEVLANENLDAFLARAQEVVVAYRSLDRRILELYQSYVGRISTLTKALDELATLTGPDALAGLLNSEAGKIVKRLWGSQLNELILEQEALQELREFAATAKEALASRAFEEALTFSSKVKRDFQLDQIFDQLASIDSATKIKNLTDEKLEGIVERIVGSGFESLKGAKLGRYIEDLHSTIDGIDAFKRKWYGALAEAADQSFKLDLSYAFTQAASHEALLDVEINLSSTKGQKLARKAAKGDFAGTLSAYDPATVRVHAGVLTHQLEKSAQLQLNVYGWGFKGLVQLIQNSEHCIETDAAGLVHVYTMETELTQLKEKKKGDALRERMQSTFLLRAVAETTQPAGSDVPVDPKTGEYLLRTLNRMGVEFRLVEEDAMMRADEMRQCLHLAEFLGLIPSREELTETLRKEFPAGFGQVRASYLVRFTDKAVRTAFELPPARMDRLARQTARELIGTRYVGKRTIAAVGFAYLDRTGEFENLFRRNLLTKSGQSSDVVIQLPAWFTGKGNVRETLGLPRRSLIRSLFALEDRFVKRLMKLDGAVDRIAKGQEPVSLEDFERHARRFVSMADDMDNAGVGRFNTFLGIFDRLVLEGSQGRGQRKTAMILEITPEGCETVTKVFMAS
jgi:hypothetical protein